MKIVIQQGRIIDPTQRLDKIMDIYIAEGKIISLHSPPESFCPDFIINAKDHWIIPGIVDLYAHLNDTYGMVQLHEATVAARRGFTTLLCAPDGQMIRDSMTRIEKFLESDISPVDVLPIGALSERLHGKAMADLNALYEAGCRLFSNGIYPMADLNLIRNIYLYAASFNFKVMIFPIEASLAKGLIHEGLVSATTGLMGIPETAETIAIAQHLLLIEETGIQAHFSHITSAAGCELIRRAKSKGLPITADCTMHHLHLTEMELMCFNPNALVFPPLRSKADQDALKQALIDGTLDAICSSHHPLPNLAKNTLFDEALSGISSLDTYLSLGLQLVKQEVLSPLQWVNKISIEPRNIYFNRSQGLGPSEPADLCIFDPKVSWKVSLESLQSHGRNSPFLDWVLPGEVVYTLKRGKIVYAPQALAREEG